MIKMFLDVIFEHIIYILRSPEICCSGHILSKKHEKIPFLKESFWDVKIDIRNRTFCLLTIKSHFLTIYHVIGAFCESLRILKSSHEIVCFLMKSRQYSICGLNPEISIWKLFFQKVWMILNIFHIYNFFIRWVFFEIEPFEISHETHFFDFTSLKNTTLRVTGIHSIYHLLRSGMCLGLLEMVFGSPQDLIKSFLAVLSRQNSILRSSLLKDLV